MRPVQPGLHDPWQWLEKQLHEERFGTARVILHDLGKRLRDASFERRKLSVELLGKRLRYIVIEHRENRVSIAGFLLEEGMRKILSHRRAKLSRLLGRLRTAIRIAAATDPAAVAAERNWVARRTAFWLNLTRDPGVVRSQMAYERRQRIRRMAAEGMTRKQIAARLGVSLSRVGVALDTFDDASYHPAAELQLQRPVVLPEQLTARGLLRTLDFLTTKRDWLVP